MPRNGVGVYTAPSSSLNDAEAGVTISSTDFNALVTDLETALTNSLAKNGETTPSANLTMGGFRHTDVGAASLRGHYAVVSQVQDQAHAWCGTAGGTANDLTLAPAPAIPAYAAGQRFVFMASADNTGAVTVAVSGLAAKAVQGWGAALLAGTIEADRWYEIVYDGAAFQLAPLFGGRSVTAGTFTRDLSVASGAQAITGVGFKPTDILFMMASSSGSTSAMSIGVSSIMGAVITNFDISDRNVVVAGTYAQSTSCITALVADGNVAATVASHDSDGFTLSWVRTGTPLGVITINYVARRF